MLNIQTLSISELIELRAYFKQKINPNKYSAVDPIMQSWWEKRNKMYENSVSYIEDSLDRWAKEMNEKYEEEKKKETDEYIKRTVEIFTPR